MPGGSKVSRFKVIADVPASAGEMVEKALAQFLSDGTLGKFLAKYGDWRLTRVDYAGVRQERSRMVARSHRPRTRRWAPKDERTEATADARP